MRLLVVLRVEGCECWWLGRGWRAAGRSGGVVKGGWVQFCGWRFRCLLACPCEHAAEKLPLLGVRQGVLHRRVGRVLLSRCTRWAGLSGLSWGAGVELLWIQSASTCVWFLTRWMPPRYLSPRFVTSPHLTPKLGGLHRFFLTGMAVEVAKTCVHMVDEPSTWIRPGLNAASQITFARYSQPVSELSEKGTYSYAYAVGAGTSLG